MTTQKHDQTEDQAFEEFLEGRGELVKQLKKLAQLSPSAALDAAILASAKAAVAQAERSKLTAANDAVSPAMPAKPGFLSSFRMPMGLAASLMVAVIVSVMWHQAEDLPEQVALAPNLPDAVEMPSVQAAVAPVATQAKVAQDDAAAAKSVTVAAGKSVAPGASVATAVPSAPAAAGKPAPVAAAPAPVAASKPAAAPAPAVTAAAVVKPATPAAQVMGVATEKNAQVQTAVSAVAPNDALKRSPERVEPVSAPLGQVAVAEQKAAVAAPPAAEAPVAAASVPKDAAKPAASPAPVGTGAAASEPVAKTELTAVDKAKAWLAAIEEMSKYDSRKEAALVQLERFEKSYPHYPVPEALKAKLKAP